MMRRNSWSWRMVIAWLIVFQILSLLLRPKVAWKPDQGKRVLNRGF